MSITTRWIDDTGKNLDQNISLLLNTTEEKIYENRTSYKNIYVTKKLDKNGEYKFRDKVVKYNIINYTYDSVIPGISPEVDRTTEISGQIIVYELDGRVSFIIDKNSNALTEIRWLLGYTASDKNVISKNESPITSKLLFWIVSKIYNDQNEINVEYNDEENKLLLNTFVGFRGKTADKISYVVADGDSVVNTLSTLSFFLESKLLQQIKLRAEYNEHENVDINLKDTKTIGVDLKKYDGPLSENGLYMEYAEVYLLVYLEIMPMLYHKYHEDLDNEVWGEEQEKQFVLMLKDKVLEIIDERLSSNNELTL